ncbi:MAG: hypothetical protein E1N59_1121 [Puniceicoccaceae bacterium 5H]|nr:MAG: hypothetical protein E1N59_1121 [Puniceicoccaceae bacterium 5H]
MLVIIAYDVADPKRLKQIADCCKDFGYRVQYSIFECRLEAGQMERLWTRLCALADPDEDRLVAYPIHGSYCQYVRTYGAMSTIDAVVSYQF